MPAQYITIDDAAEIIDVSDGMMYRWIREGRVLGYRLGGYKPSKRFVRTT